MKKVIFTILTVAIIVTFIVLSARIDISPLVDSLGNSIWGWLGFLFLQILQIIFIPINGLILVVPAVTLFGSFTALCLLYIGKVIGSIFVFYIGKSGGSKLLKKLIGKENVEKYIVQLKTNHIFLISLLLFPIAPDDIVCIGAGMCQYSYKFFIPTIMITRLIELVTLIYIGGEMVKTTLGTIILVSVYVVFYIGLFLYQRRKNKICTSNTNI